MNKSAIILISLLLLSVLFSIDFDAYAKSSKHQNSIFLSEQNDSKIQVNKYLNYVHFQPDWKSYPGNLIFDITNIWNRTDVGPPLVENESQRGARTNVNDLQYLDGKPYLEVQYDYIDCNYQWIHYARSGLDALGSKLDYLAGKQLDSDHHSALFSLIPVSDRYDSETSSYYSQFIPICTSKDTTTFDYGIRIDDDSKGFDVYFVPSINERSDYHNNRDDFTYYAGCSGLGYNSYSGTCRDVDKHSGLVVVIPDTLDKPLTKISVKLKEH